MLMHEWRQYRDRQIHKVVKEAREAEEPEEEQAAEAEAEVEAVEPQPARAQAVEAPVEPETELEDEQDFALKSEPGKPKQILERLAAGNSEMRDRLEALHARQQVLPLDVEAAAQQAPRRRGRVEESREQLVQRLTDPVLSLEEAAVLLDVCPTTVRRYTNRGVLKCYRTPGNQRRFRLSEIMSFMERRQMGEE
ncbi:MAG: helix-turn-helix domain-containing protein [Armatimonadia bacterium]